MIDVTRLPRDKQRINFLVDFAQGTLDIRFANKTLEQGWQRLIAQDIAEAMLAACGYKLGRWDDRSKITLIVPVNDAGR